MPSPGIRIIFVVQAMLVLSAQPQWGAKPTGNGEQQGRSGGKQNHLSRHKLEEKLYSVQASSSLAGG